MYSNDPLDPLDSVSIQQSPDSQESAPTADRIDQPPSLPSDRRHNPSVPESETERVSASPRRPPNGAPMSTDKRYKSSLSSLNYQLVGDLYSDVTL